MPLSDVIHVVWNDDVDWDKSTFAPELLRLVTKQGKLLMKIERMEFPACCAYYIFHSYAVYDNHVKENVEDVIEFMEEYGRHYEYARVMYITTNSSYYVNMNNLFKKRGWLLEEETENPHSGHVVFRWSFDYRD